MKRNRFPSKDPRCFAGCISTSVITRNTSITTLCQVHGLRDKGSTIVTHCFAVAKLTKLLSLRACVTSYESNNANVGTISRIVCNPANVCKMHTIICRHTMHAMCHATCTTTPISFNIALRRYYCRLLAHLDESEGREIIPNKILFSHAKCYSDACASRVSPRVMKNLCYFAHPLVSLHLVAFVAPAYLHIAECIAPRCYMLKLCMYCMYRAVRDRSIDY